MNHQKSSKKTIIFIIVIIILALSAYFYYQGQIPISDSPLEASEASSDAQAVGSRILSLLKQIKSLKIDTDIFDDPSYSTLRDYSVAIPEENVGRVNPFAPLPGSFSQASTSRSGGQR